MNVSLSVTNVGMALTGNAVAQTEKAVPGMMLAEGPFIPGKMSLECSHGMDWW